MQAKDLAQSLAAKFLEEGNFEALGAPLGRGAAQRYAQAASSRIVDQHYDEGGFASLAVQSVGYTAGAEREEVVIYASKGSKKELSALPEEMDGVPIVARLMGKLHAGPAPAMARSSVSHYFERAGRIACGSSCAPSGENYAGTLGAFITLGAGHFALSNNHVFAACNHTPVGMPILAPSAVDAQPGRSGPTEFAQYERMVELRSGDPALVSPCELDAAIAAVIDDSLITSWQGGNDGYDTPNLVNIPSSGVRVKKMGRTTGLTFGTVEALQPAPWPLHYEADRFSALVWLINTWTVRSNDADPFALPGDSGSLIVTEDETAAIGLLFAVNNRGKYGIFMPIQEALNAFGAATLLSHHGV